MSPSPFRRRAATWEEKEEYKKNNYSNLEHIDVPVEVLQMVVVGDMEVVAECIDIIEQGNKTEGEQ
ncbi:MAG: hypothetical protein EOO27_02260 [Comamonadaceae bacterium]|nr:MAG: hypothetical protein EOO27_02260 [Comamonadaceae bacterium]